MDPQGPPFVRINTAPMRSLPLLLLATLTTSVPAQWIREEALPDTETASVLVHGEGLFAGGINAVYHQPQPGAPWETWQELPGDPVYVDAMAHHNGALYAGTGGNHMFRAPNAATLWQLTPGLVGLGGHMVTCIAEFDGDLYCGTAGEGTFKFNGTEWNYFGDLDPFSGLNVNFLRTIGDTLWCGAGGNGYLFFITAGATDWTPVNVQMVTGPIIFITDLIELEGEMLAGSSTGIHRSTDHGATWQPLPGANWSCNALQITRWGDALIASRTTAYTRWYRSDDNGGTWDLFSTTPLSFNSTVYDGRLYSGRLDGLWYMEPGSTGLAERAAFTFGLAPNPAADVVRIRLVDPELATYAVFDMQGRTVMSGRITSNGTQLSVEGLDRGTYVVRVEQEGRVASDRLVVQ